MSQPRLVAFTIPAPVRFGLLALAVLVMLAMNMDVMWATSVDLAHHYALVTRLSELWTLPNALDPSLGEMNVYPRLSHQVAAILGRLAGSPLVGLQMVTIFSLLLVWASAAWMLQTLPRVAAIATSMMVVLLLALNAQTLQMQLHGDEVAGNFFFSQLAGQGFVMAVMAACLSLDSAGKPAWLRNALLAGAIWLATGIHLMPALELLCFMGALVMLDLLQHRYHRHPRLLPVGAVGVLLLLGALALLVTHPAFRAMASISNNNGTMFTNHLASIKSMLNYSAVVVLISVLIIWRWLALERREAGGALLAAKYIGIYGLSISGLCLLQALAWKAGFGSEYAVKKYIAALNSVTLLELALLPVLLLRSLRQPGAGGFGPAALLHGCVLPAALTALGFYCAVAGATKTIDVSDLAGLEQKLVLRRDLLVPSQPGKYTYVAGMDGLPPHLAYMMSIGLFSTPRSVNAGNLLAGEALTEWGMVGSMLTTEGSYLDKDPVCRRSAPAQGIAVLDGQCVARFLLPPREDLSFGARTGPSPCTMEGFGEREPNSTWTVSTEAKLVCPVPLIKGKAPTRIELEGAAFLAKIPSQRVTFTVAGGAPLTFVYDAANADRTIVLPMPAGVGSQVEITLALPDARSPQELGLSGDQRKLGLALRWLHYK